MISEHPWLCLFAAVVAGMILEWVLELFFLRSRLFQLDADLQRCRRESGEQRHLFDQVQKELRSKGDLLTAVQNSKREVEARVAGADGRAEAAQRELAAGAAVLARVQRELEVAARENLALKAELEGARSAAVGWQAERATLTAELETVRESRQALERELAVRDSEQVVMAERGAVNGRERAALESVVETLGGAVRMRDGEVERLRERLGVLEAAEGERSEKSRVAQAGGEAVAEELHAREREIAELFARVARLEEENGALRVASAGLAAVEETRRILEAQNHQLTSELGDVRRESSAAQAALDGCRSELATVAGKASALEEELAVAARANESLTVRLKGLEPGMTSREGTGHSPGGAPAALLKDLEDLTRERNALAAELAVVRASSKRPASRGGMLVSGGPAGGLIQGTLLPEAEEEVIESVAACPQHLSDIRGIGSAFETRLYAAGIGSYWEFSQLKDEQLWEILDLGPEQRGGFDAAAARLDAFRLARETRSRGRRWSREPPDDFEPLEGIGRTYEKKLYDAGICTFESLARATVEQLAEICPPTRSRRPEYSRWIEQARARLEAGGSG